MNNLDIYKIAEKEKIEILKYYWTNCKARIFEIDKSYYVALNYNKIENSIDEKEILTEELVHYFCNDLYHLNDDIVLKRKCEYRARKWQFKTLVPLIKLKNLFEKGYKYSYEIAEQLEVSQELLQNAYEYYRENNLIDY